MEVRSSSSVRFGVFEFNPEVGELRKFGVRVKLCPQASKVLALLLERSGRPWTREELRQQLWPKDTFVDFEHSLNKAIHSLRQALGDSASNPRYIETVHGQGYRCLAGAQELMQTPVKGQALHELKSIAVLPFGSECDEPDVPFLEQQIALRLINALSKGSTLRVLAYTTVKRYRAAVANPQAVGRDLGVQAALVGEIVRRNEEALICAELIDVTDGTHLWGTQLKQSWINIVERGDQIAEEISRELTSALSSSGKTSLPRGPVAASTGVLLKRA